MRALVDIIGTVSGSIRFIFGIFFLCIFGLGLLVTVGAGVIVPQATEKVAEEAKLAAEEAREAREREYRARAYAADGWGYPTD